MDTYSYMDKAYNQLSDRKSIYFRWYYRHMSGGFYNTELSISCCMCVLTNQVLCCELCRLSYSEKKEICVLTLLQWFSLWINTVCSCGCCSGVQAYQKVWSERDETWLESQMTSEISYLPMLQYIILFFFTQVNTCTVGMTYCLVSVLSLWYISTVASRNLMFNYLFF